MTNFVFGILIGLFVVAMLVVAALVFLDGLLDQGGVVGSPLSVGLTQLVEGDLAREIAGIEPSPSFSNWR